MKRNNEPVKFVVECLFVTDCSIFELYKKKLNTDNEELIFNYMRVYHSHLMTGVGFDFFST